MLHVWNPRGGWWGEGDEKFFVDGEKFPSTFGTGSEDYFGYAWGNPHLFQKPYHCPDDDPEQPGPPVVAALAHRRQRAVPEVVRGLHREVFHERSRHALRLHRAAGISRPAARTPTGRCRPPSATATTSRPKLVVNGFKVLNEPAGEAAVQRAGRLRRQEMEERRSNFGGPAPSRAPSWNWACPWPQSRQLRGQRPPDQGPRLRHRAALAGRQEGRRADRPVQPGRRSQRPDRRWAPTT